MKTELSKGSTSVTVETIDIKLPNHKPDTTHHKRGVYPYEKL